MAKASIGRVCVSIGIVIASVHALSARADDETAGSGVSSLDEIIVTAQKRAENIQNVPIIVTAISASDLTAAKIDTTQDLQFMVPALVYSSASGYAMPYLRGIGSAFTMPNADPSVATYIDGAYVASDQATIENLLGVQRVEVLEGPQGTLYGRNAVGGAINVITLTPSQTPQGQVTLTGGNYARKEGSANISGGVTDDLAVGLYLGGSLMNPYVEPVTALNPVDPTHESEWGGRLKAVYTPTSRLTLTGSFEATKTVSYDEDAYRELSPAALVFLLFPTTPRAGAPYTAAGGLPVRAQITQEAATLREEYDFDWANLVGISNYRNLVDYGALDLSASAIPLLGGAVQPQTSRQYSQELQLLSPSGSAIRWIGGLFLYHEKGADFPDETYSAVLFVPGTLVSSNVYGEVNTDSVAAFGQATLPLNVVANGLNLTLGGRFTSDSKHYYAFSSTTDSAGTDLGPITTYSDLPNSHTWNQFTPKASLEYQLENTLYYFSYSEGFKSGAYNITAPTAFGPVNPEKLNDFEIGAKSRLWNGRIQWDSGAYYYDYKDLQVQITNFAQAGSTLLENAADAKAYGLESSFELRVTDALRVTASAIWSHSEYTKFPNYAAVDQTTLAPETISATGNELQEAPNFVGTLGAKYDAPLAAGTLHASANLYYNGGYYWSPDNTIRQGGYALLNSTLGYTLPGDHWTVSAWGKNLTNRLYETGIEQIATFGIYAQDAPPRMYGVTVNYAYK
jgi:outer membrane receptor protein involved in Fe transport